MVIMYICYTSDKSACEISKIKRFMNYSTGYPATTTKKRFTFNPFRLMMIR
jgi:hypothetical protein